MGTMNDMTEVRRVLEAALSATEATIRVVSPEQVTVRILDRSSNIPFNITVGPSGAYVTVSNIEFDVDVEIENCDTFEQIWLGKLDALEAWKNGVLKVRGEASTVARFAQAFSAIQGK